MMYSHGNDRDSVNDRGKIWLLIQHLEKVPTI
jgi:hypothetical protein